MTFSFSLAKSSGATRSATHMLANVNVTVPHPTQDRLIHRVRRPSPARQHRRQPRTHEQVQLELVDSDACKPKALKQGAPK